MTVINVERNEARGRKNREVGQEKSASRAKRKVRERKLASGPDTVESNNVPCICIFVYANRCA